MGVRRLAVTDHLGINSGSARQRMLQLFQDQRTGTEQSNAENGELLGAAFPERGVLLGYLPEGSERES